jgi:hypothetical protein
MRLLSSRIERQRDEGKTMTRRSKKTGRFIRSRRRSSKHITSTRRKTRGGRRIEKWKGKRGRVRVRRNRKGQFVTWRKLRRYTRGKTAKRKWGTTARTRKWAARAGKRRILGGRGAAVWGGNKRIEIRGTGRNSYNAVKLAYRHPPKEQFLDITAEEVLHHPERFLDYRSSWQGRPEIESI